MANNGYNFVVRGKDFKVIDNTVVKIIKQSAGKIPQHGIRKWSNAYVLQSNSQYDISDVFRNEGWAHSSSALIKKGTVVYVVPSNKVEASFKAGAVGVMFTATDDMYEDINNEFSWSSN